ncbi:MAG: chemotaxis protein CheW [Betaproteobacteria bacterium HGW-Betaproteobacteria-11]|nr:MAG: chemotaxis protein CheW [Betaproteobacteria bacterium HGW-Betaproteobacteria-11]
MSTHKPAAPKTKKVATDWRAIHRRLDTVRAGIERMGAPNAEETQRILRTRAQTLAQEPVKAEAAAESLEVVEFLLAYEKYAVESRYVREVYPLENLTPLPCTPAFVLGIVSVRGEITSVIDIKKFFDLPEKGLTDLNQVIVLQTQDMVFGVLADAILGVRHLSLAEIQPSLPTLTGIREKYLRGVTPERIVVLDAEKLLTGEQIIVQEQVAG